MRLLLRIVTSCVGILLLLAIAVLVWFRYYTRDLPDIDALSKYAPASVSQVSDPCLKESVAIPYNQIGVNLVYAVEAVETRLPQQISRTMFCTPSKQLAREVAELRVATHIERRFSQRQILTIYLNRVYFGGTEPGVHSAAQYLSRENPDQLDIAQAALLAGLLRSPSFYSPNRHPDRALKRRNEVIDAMLARGSVGRPEAEAAKTEPLPNLR